MAATETRETNDPLPATARFPIHPPAWASVFGEDDSGIFAEFEMDSIVFRLRWIPPGQFLLGSPEDDEFAFSNEKPRHEVEITRGFWLGDTPVTQSQWEAIAGEKNPGHFEGPNRPVETVSWKDCQVWLWQLNFIFESLDAGLPTEAQWEYACRAGTESAFNDGSDCTDSALAELGWFDENSENQTHEVKRKQPNAWGLYDMHGNVWEWCLDGRRDYSEETGPDPIGSTEAAARRALRGGSWAFHARFCRSAYRGVWPPVDRNQARASAWPQVSLVSSGRRSRKK